MLHHTIKTLSLSLALAYAVATPALAEVSAAEAAKLGKSLTAMGAEAGPNASGTIPAWTGGLTKPAAGYKEGGHYPDPYASDKPLFVIDAGNVDKYQANLSPGQIAMIKKYPDFKMSVYPTRRSAAMPKRHYDETIANATKAKLAPGGNGIVGTNGGVPFPIPKDGEEAIWNSLLRYRGDSFANNWGQAAVTREGTYTMVRLENDFMIYYGNVSLSEQERGSNRMWDLIQRVTAPARLAGGVLLVKDYPDGKTERPAWRYNPGHRRVRLAPQVAYDNPGTASDGLRTNDDYLLFNGATDRYNWKLLGKREMYIPYNSYKLSSDTYKYSDILKAGHLNMDLPRYELHRVWVVEATLKEGTSHVYKRRTFYIDEDSWLLVLSDKYDNRGQLWRFAEGHSIVNSGPYVSPWPQVHYDLQSGRYIAMGLMNEEPKVDAKIKLSPGDLTPAALRGQGTQ
jgi:hypothetical protein